MKSQNRLITEKFEKHINLIVDTFNAKIFGIDSIILYGSYGRGEGAWIESNGSYDPYNDYDVLIVLVDGVKVPKNIALIKEELLKKINITWIDLSFTNLTKFLGNNSKSIFQYDLIHGSKVIFGNFNLLKNISKFESSEIDLYEGKLLFFTRLWPFIGGVKINKDLDSSEALFFRYQMSKVILAVVDMILLMRGGYNSSYVKRCENVVKICENNNILDVKIIDWAINQKLNPSSEAMSMKDVINLQERVAKIFSIHSLELLSIIYKKKFSNLIEFRNFYSTSLSERLKILAGFILRKKK